MERKTVLIIFGLVFLLGFGYSLSKGLDLGTSTISGFGLGAVAMLLIYFGTKLVKPY